MFCLPLKGKKHILNRVVWSVRLSVCDSRRGTCMIGLINVDFLVCFLVYIGCWFFYSVVFAVLYNYANE